MKSLINRKGESITDDKESTETSQEFSEEQNSTSDIYIEDKEDSKSIEISQVHNVLNKSIPNEVDSHTVEDVTEIELPKENGEQNNAKEDKVLTTNFEVNHKTKSSEYIFICQDDKYILHLLHLKKFCIC